tara:strand:+ start:1023 stop:1349 length:327 start_codon:yes stop_codon:yes gene_type:complete
VSETSPFQPISIAANAPGEFQAEVELSGQSDPAEVVEQEEQVARCMGLNLLENGNVLITLVDDVEDVSLEIKPRDFSAIHDLVRLCHDRVTTDQAAKRADADGEADRV